MSCPGAAITWYVTSGDSVDTLSAEVDQHGETLVENEWVSIVPWTSDGERTLNELYFRAPDGLSTAKLLLVVTDNGDDYTCRLDGYIGGV